MDRLGGAGYRMKQWREHTVNDNTAYRRAIQATPSHISIDRGDGVYAGHLRRVVVVHHRRVCLGIKENKKKRQKRNEDTKRPSHHEGVWDGVATFVFDMRALTND